MKRGLIFGLLVVLMVMPLVVGADRYIVESDDLSESLEDKVVDVIDSVQISRQKAVAGIGTKRKFVVEDVDEEDLEDDSIINVEPDYEIQALGETPWNYYMVGFNFSNIDNNLGESVKIAVLDTGIDFGLVDAVSGYDFVNEDSDATDDDGHGTFVSQIIKNPETNLPMKGVEIYSVKVLDENGDGYTSDVIEGINWAIENDMDLVLMSFGGDGNSEFLKSIIDYAYANGILFIAASGNSGDENIVYPAKYNSVIAVGSVNENGEMSSFTSYGGELELLAPGENIIVTDGEFEYLVGGTSFSVPHAGAVAAAYWSEDESLNNIDVREMLQDTKDGDVVRWEKGVKIEGTVYFIEETIDEDIRKPFEDVEVEFTFYDNSTKKVLTDEEGKFGLLTSRNISKVELFYDSETVFVANEIANMRELIFNIYPPERKFADFGIQASCPSGRIYHGYFFGPFWDNLPVNVNKRPIVLIHGWSDGKGDVSNINNPIQSQVSDWGDIEDYLADQDKELWRLEYWPANLDDRKNAGIVRAAIYGILSYGYNYNQVDIIAHSNGGLITRGYIESMGENSCGFPRSYNNDIRKLVLVSSPLYGSYFANIINDNHGYFLFSESEATKDFEIGSNFTWELNNKIPNNNVDYLTIGGKRTLGTILGFDLDNSLETNDGIVSVVDANMLKDNVDLVILNNFHGFFENAINQEEKVGRLSELFFDGSLNYQSASSIIGSNEIFYSKNGLSDTLPSDLNNKGAPVLSINNPEKISINSVSLIKLQNEFPLRKNVRTGKWFYIDDSNFQSFDFTTMIPLGSYRIKINNNLHPFETVQVNKAEVTLKEVNLDNDQDGYDLQQVGGTDCNDQNSNIHPNAQEQCNNIDDDCDNLVDEGGVCDTTCDPVNVCCDVFGKIIPAGGQPDRPSMYDGFRCSNSNDKDRVYTNFDCTGADPYSINRQDSLIEICNSSQICTFSSCLNVDNPQEFQNHTFSISLSYPPCGVGCQKINYTIIPPNSLPPGITFDANFTQSSTRVRLLDADGRKIEISTYDLCTMNTLNPTCPPMGFSNISYDVMDINQTDCTITTANTTICWQDFDTLSMNRVESACIPNIVNISITGWDDVSCLTNDMMNQSNTFIEYDTNNCGVFENITFIEYRQTESCNYCRPQLNTGGDFMKIETPNRFELSYGTKDVMDTKITSHSPNGGLPILLADGSYTDKNNDEFNYTQKIDLANWSLTMFDDNDYKEDSPTIGVKIANGGAVLNYTLEFIDKPSWDDLPTSELPLLGKRYYVLNITKNTILNLLDVSEGVIHLADVEERQVNISGKNYNVSINTINSSAVRLEVNGEITDPLTISEMQKLSDDAYIVIKNINSEDNSVEFYLSQYFVELFGSDIQINGETLIGMQLILTSVGDVTGDKFSKIDIRWNAYPDQFIANESFPRMPGFDTVELNFSGMHFPVQEKFSVVPSSSTTITLKDFPLKDSVENIDILYKYNNSGFGWVDESNDGIGKNKDSQLATSATNLLLFNATQDEYFVASWSDGQNAESYLMRVVGWGASNGVPHADVQYKNDGSWTTVGENIQASDIVAIGNMELAINGLNSTIRYINFTAGTNVNFSTLYSKEGAKIYLPWPDKDNKTVLGALHQINTTVTNWNLTITEEDKEGNIGRGDNITLVIGLNAQATSDVHVSNVLYKTHEKDSSGFASEIGNTQRYLNYIYSPLATEVIWDKSGNQYSVDLTYHGGESYGNFFLSSHGLNKIEWSDWKNQTQCLDGNYYIQNRSRVQYDINYDTCYAITQLPSDLWNNGENETYWEFRNETCEFCTPDIVNTSWSSWTNLTCSLNQTNQSRYLIQHDNNSCGTIPNQTFYEYQLVGPSYLNTTWSEWENASCLNIDRMNQTRSLVQYDLFSCASNSTFTENRSTESCDFCNYTISYTNWTEWSNQSECVDSLVVQNRSRIQYDSNYSNCYAITNLSSDLWQNQTEWEFRDVSCEYKLLTLNSPLPSNYSERRIPVDLVSEEMCDEINYIDDESRRSRERILCRNCDSHSGSITFGDGQHGARFSCIVNDTVIDSKNVSFLVDSRDPRISKTEPRRNKFTNGFQFYVKVREDNLASIMVNYNPQIPLDINSCTESRGYQEYYIDLNLSDYDGQEIEYHFIVTDVANNTDESRPTVVKVDTTPPVLNNNESFWEQGEGRYSNYIFFNLNITEMNFEEATYTYVDSRGRERERRLCSRLDKEDRDDITGLCEKRVRFSDGDYELVVKILDEAGNSIEEEIGFEIV